jgi:hypothetical protein
MGILDFLQDFITNLNGVPLSEMFENFLLQFETFDNSIPFFLKITNSSMPFYEVIP